MIEAVSPGYRWKGTGSNEPGHRGNSCPLLELLLREDRERATQFLIAPRDVLAQCPGCKAMETLEFTGDVMTPSRKFTQKEDAVYHDCGSDRPCLLRGHRH